MPCQAFRSSASGPHRSLILDPHHGSCHRSQFALTNSLTSAGRTSTASQATRKEARSSARLRKARAETLKMSLRESLLHFIEGNGMILGSEHMRIGVHGAIEARALTSAHY